MNVRHLLTLFFALVLVAMLSVTGWASFDRSVLQAGREIWSDPWSRATLFDAYFGFLTVWIWIAHREPTWPRRIGWLILLLGLGNIAIAAYFLIAIAHLGPGESWRELFRPFERYGARRAV